MPYDGPTRSAPFLRKYQSRVLLQLLRGVATARGETFTVLFPRQSGKNELQAALVACLLLDNMSSGGNVVICAPTYSPQAEISVARLRRALAIAAPMLPASGSQEAHASVVRVGAATATFLSASPDAHVAGHTASLALIGDEAQEIDEEWFNRQFRPMAASTGASTVLFGTPWDGYSMLDRAVARNRRRDADCRAGQGPYTFIPRHHQVCWETVAAFNSAYGEYVLSERARLGEAHPLFQTQYALVASTEQGRLLSNDDLATMEGGFASLGGPRSGERYVGGLDFGGDGTNPDATVLTIARIVAGRCEVVAHRAYRGWPYLRMEEAISREVRRWALERLCADASGLGAPLCAHLEGATGGDVIERVVFTSASKSDLGFAMQAAARAGRLLLYAEDGSEESRVCRRELRACLVRLAGGGRIQWEAPPGEHDDYVASMALCLHAAESVGAPRVALGRVRG